MQMDAELLGELCGCLDDDIIGLVSQDGAQTRPILLHRSGHFRCLHINCALRRSLTNQPHHIGSVLYRIDTGAHLDGGGFEGHLSLPLDPVQAASSGSSLPARSSA